MARVRDVEITELPAEGPTIMADAAWLILTGQIQDSGKPDDSDGGSGQSYIDEDVLRSAGVEDFASYAVDPDENLQPDFFI